MTKKLRFPYSSRQSVFHDIYDVMDGDFKLGKVYIATGDSDHSFFQSCVDGFELSVHVLKEIVGFMETQPTN